MNVRKILRVAAFALSLGAASTAGATVFTLNVTLNATPDTTLTIPIPLPGVQPLRDRIWGFNYQSFTPFAPSIGDTIDLNVTFRNPVTMFAGFSGSSSIIFQNFVPDPGYVDTTTTSIAFLGASGGFLGNPPPRTDTVDGATFCSIGTPPSTQRAECIIAGTRGPLINSFFTFTGLDLTIGITDISNVVADFDFGTLSLLDGTPVPIPAPAPSALALLGFGLAGLAKQYIRKRV